MEQIQIFPFSRDGYHYDVQPGYTPVFEVVPADEPGDAIWVWSPEEYGWDGLIAINETIEGCEEQMRDSIHETRTLLMSMETGGYLNDAGLELLKFYHSHITKQP